MIVQILLFILDYIIPVLIIIQGKKLASQKTEYPLISQLWKLTGYLLLPATLIVSILSVLRPLNTQLILTVCTLIMQTIIFIFLKNSENRLSDTK